MNTIGTRLRAARENAKLTIKEVSTLSNISTGNLSKLENNVNKPSSDALISLSNIYNVSIDWILRGHHYEKSSSGVDQLLISDPEIMNFMDKISNLWCEADRDLRGWIKVQFRRAFPEIAEEIKEERES
jgi:transcriptional regulator with XRE-family HTH domain